MKLTKKNKTFIGIAALFLLLIITNPSVTAFKSYLGKNSYAGLMRKSNYFVYSTYVDNTYDDDRDIQHSDRYIGFVGNFFRRDQEDKQPTANIDSSAKADTVAITSLPYKDRVYIALKENIKGFDVPERTFYTKIKDRSYDLKVYSALKDNLQGFNKTPQQFISLINE